MGSVTGTADAYNILVTPSNTGLVKGVHQTEEAATKVSELLQEDLKRHHVFFNDSGFHNHVPHHLLALYGTGAAPEIMQARFEENSNYQRPAQPPAAVLKAWTDAAPLLGQGKNYSAFLSFFQEQIAAQSPKQVLHEYVLKGDAAADDMLARMFAGFLHPMIQLMYGVEWAQPAMVAEALAQTAVHGDEGLKSLLFAAEARSRAAAAASPGGGGGRMPAVLDLYRAVGADEKLASCVTVEMESKVREGVLGSEETHRAILDIMSRVGVAPEEVPERTAEMFDASVFVAASAAAHPVKYPKFDFFLIHHVNVSPIFLTLNAQDWIAPETKARLLEWKIRMDLLQYAARGCPPLDLERIKRHTAKEPEAPTPMAVISRLHARQDDGHAVKLGRAALVCQQNSRQYEDRKWMMIRGDNLWMQVHHLVVDSVESPGTWVRSTGLEGAWKDIPDASSKL